MASKFWAGKVLIHDFCETVLAFWADKGITTQEQFLPLDNFHFFKLLQDLRKSTFKTLYVGANGIRSHAHVVPVRKSW